MTADAASIQLVAAYQELMVRLRRATASMVTDVWAALGSWDRSDAPRFVQAVEPIVTAAQTHAVTLTDSYIASVGTQATGTAVAPAGLDPGAYTGGQVRGGVTAAEEWARPFHSYWTALSEGKPWDESLAAGSRRASDLADTDVALAARASARDAMTAHSPKVVGYRRVMTGAKTCIYCAVASTKRYHIAGLMPLHLHCDCAIGPIWGKKDPGNVINRDLLTKIQQGTSRSDYWRAHGFVARHGETLPADEAVKVVEHGEYGPVLVSRTHDFTGPTDL